MNLPQHLSFTTQLHFETEFNIMTECTFHRFLDAVGKEFKDGDFRKELGVKALKEVNELIDSRVQLSAAVEEMRKQFKIVTTANVKLNEDLNLKHNEKEAEIEKVKKEAEERLTRSVSAAKFASEVLIQDALTQKDTAIAALQTKHATDLGELNDRIREKEEEIQRVRDELTSATTEMVKENQDLRMEVFAKDASLKEKDKTITQIKADLKRMSGQVRSYADTNAELKKTATAFTQLSPLVDQFENIGTLFETLTNAFKKTKTDHPGAQWPSTDGSFTLNNETAP